MTIRNWAVVLSPGVLTAALLLAFGGIDSFQPEAAGDESHAANRPLSNRGDARKDRHALIVGVSYYENLPKHLHLKGTSNDVELVRRLLLDKLEFGPERIAVLSDAEGKRRGKDYLPTRANIAREFKRLAKVVAPNDQVFIHIGGHGSQQPEDKNAPDPEPDGLDEIFLPRDCGSWESATQKVANAIVDDELGAWLKAIRDARASVWVTFDACHSGTMIRGGDEEAQAREVDPIKDLGIPAAAIQKAKDFAREREAKSGERSRGGASSSPSPSPFKLAKEGGIVAIYACQAHEKTLDLPLPLDCGDARYHGILTFALCTVLTEATEKASTPLTYNELARRIHALYVQWEKARSTPLIEGVDRDRQVLGDKVWPGRSSIWLTVDGADMTINAGAIHGLTRGSILAVYPAPGKGDKLAGHVRIENLKTLDAAVAPCAYGGKELVKKLPAGGVCKLVFSDSGDQQLKVAVDPKGTDGQGLAPDALTRLTTVLNSLAGTQSLIRPTGSPRQADWLVRVRGTAVILVPGAGWSAERDAVGEKRFGPFANDEKLAAVLRESLEIIARGESLKRLAAAESGIDRALGLELKFLRRKDLEDKTGTIPIEWPAPDVKAHDGDLLVIRVGNKGRSPIDVTLLYMDSGYGIDCIYPADGQLNRIQPDEAELVKIKVTSKTVGREYLVAIAVKGQGQPVDFSMFGQPSLEMASRGADDLKKVLETPLGKLLKRGMYGQGTTRGRNTQELEDYGMMIVPMQIRPEKR
jgi:hypothetical protein